jgi:hypothetical protein
LLIEAPSIRRYAPWEFKETIGTKSAIEGRIKNTVRPFEKHSPGIPARIVFDSGEGHD